MYAAGSVFAVRAEADTTFKNAVALRSNFTIENDKPPIVSFGRVGGSGAARGGCGEPCCNPAGRSVLYHYRLKISM